MGRLGNHRHRGTHQEVSHGDKAVESCLCEDCPQLGGQDSGDPGQINCCRRRGLQEDPTKEFGVRQSPTLATTWKTSRVPRGIRAGAQVMALLASPLPQPSAMSRPHSGAVTRSVTYIQVSPTDGAKDPTGPSADWGHPKAGKEVVADLAQVPRSWGVLEPHQVIETCSSS